MLQGHAVYILVERVEKPTYKRAAPSLCCRVADADSLETIGRRWPRRPSRYTLPRWGQQPPAAGKGEPPKRITRD